MLEVSSDKTIEMTRGDTVVLTVGGKTGPKPDSPDYIFKPGDVVRFTVIEKGHYDRVVLSKDVTVTDESVSVDIPLTKDDTRFGEVISKPKDYNYEIELNPEGVSQTIIGYDKNGPKIFRLFPEGDNTNGY